MPFFFGWFSFFPYALCQSRNIQTLYIVHCTHQTISLGFLYCASHFSEEKMNRLLYGRWVQSKLLHKFPNSPSFRIKARRGSVYEFLWIRNNEWTDQSDKSNSVSKRFRNQLLIFVGKFHVSALAQLWLIRISEIIQAPSKPCLWVNVSKSTRMNICMKMWMCVCN